MYLDLSIFEQITACLHKGMKCLEAIGFLNALTSIQWPMIFFKALETDKYMKPFMVGLELQKSDKSETFFHPFDV